MANKPVLAVDVDEVIAYFIPALAEFHNEAFGGTVLTAQSFHSYDFCHVWGGTIEDSYVKMDGFYASSHFLNLKPIPHAFETLKKLQDDFELHVVTSRQFAIQDPTLKWVEQHFPNIFTEIHFGNHYSREGKVRSKPEICRDIGAVLLIDDSLQYALHCYKADIPVLLFGEYAWNQRESVCPTNFESCDVRIAAFDAEEHSAALATPDSGTLYRISHWHQIPQAIRFLLPDV